MLQDFRFFPTFTFVCAMLLLGLANALAAPVALLIEFSGPGEIEFEPFSEIDAGSKIALGMDGRLEFLDYINCKTVVIEGGQVNFTKNGFFQSDVMIMKESHDGCPKLVTLNEDARVGGVRLRSGSATSRLSTRPWFAFTGRKGGAAAQVRIIHPGSPILTFPVKGRQFRWPEEQDELAAGRYELEVLSEDGTNSRRVPFKVSGSGRRSKMTIIRMN